MFIPSTFRVAINYRDVSGPWGGASVFIRQLKTALKRCRISVRFDLKKDVDLILMIDPREDLQKTAFGQKAIAQYKKRHPHTKVVHRVNECDARKGTTFMDDILEQANHLADHTIFISEWLRDYFSSRWFNKERPHTVIYNGADERFFHPVGTAVYKGVEPFILVTHHWSDNPMKGFPVYQQVDEWIADGTLKNVELRIIGRWPSHIVWQSAKTFPPASGKQLADMLRECHVYLTASLFEPCGMHHVEGAQCGLPLLCHVDGGGIVEAAEKYGVLYQDDLMTQIENVKLHYPELRRRVLAQMPSGGAMAAAYVRVLQRVMAE